MGEVITLFKILPKDSGSFEAMKEKVLQQFEDVQKVEQEDIAFGLKALKITLVIPDSSGGTDKIEEKINAIPEVGSVELEGIGRI